ncbi:hypothetical protein [Streptomyces cacaoi]|uniref:hypothetical protein n=1 Tax=Streptomyces cacaoi TaxID=1898 RepID=UPI000A39A735|nr:hypothetical protein [Streptomyces cacaoi]NNG89203.1 hypothetical protein [Streptomyces cacaoi]
MFLSSRGSAGPLALLRDLLRPGLTGLVAAAGRARQVLAVLRRLRPLLVRRRAALPGHLA